MQDGLSACPVLHALLQDGPAQPLPVGHGPRTVGQGAPRGEVQDGIARGIDKRQAIVERVQRTGIVVILTHDVAAEGERGVVQAELAHERGQEVGLGAYPVNLHGLGNSTAQPEQRHVVATRVGLADSLGIANAVVGQADNEQVVPQGCLLHAADKTPQAIVDVSHGILLGTQPVAVVGHLPVFVAGQGKERRHPGNGVAVLQDALAERVERNGIGHAPGVGAPDGMRKVAVSYDSLIAVGHEEALGVCKVDVAAVEELRAVASLRQDAGHRAQRARLLGHFHGRQLGKALIAAQDAHRATVGTIAVGIELGKGHSLVPQLVKMRRNACSAPQGLDKRTGKALHDYQYDVGTQGFQQGRGVYALSGEASLGIQGIGLVLGEESVHLVKFFRLKGRCQKAEDRIDGRMVDVLVLGKVDCPDVHRRLAHAATDKQERHAAHQQQAQGGRPAVLHGRPLGPPCPAQQEEYERT